MPQVQPPCQRGAVLTSITKEGPDAVNARRGSSLAPMDPEHMQALTARLPPLTKIAIAILTILSCPLVGLSASKPAVGEDRMVLGPRQFETDKGGGAVLCAWSMYLSVRTQTIACAVSRQPGDDKGLLAAPREPVMNPCL